ncbi:MAG: helix-hairpin-helix domain-containing protein [Alistipes sp.]|nr:helix-hairpin-helix domain-containing protein [Alistipes sp.]
MRLFTEEQRRGVVVVLPLLAVVVLLSVLAERSEWRKLSEREQSEVEIAEEKTLSPFDPNSFEYEQLREAGLSVEVAAGIVRWRQYGKVYRVKEDIALVSGVTDSIYAQLKPYIIIADSLAPKPKESSDYENKREYRATSRANNKPAAKQEIAMQPFMIDTASVEYLSQIGFTAKQAAALIKYRDAIGGISSVEELSACYVVSEQMAERLASYVIFSEKKSKTEAVSPSQPIAEKRKIEINSADSVALVAVDGIGPKSAADILRYRELLGGYHSIEQLSEVKTVTEQNYNKFFKEFCCDSCKISKIDINFASPKDLERHPYVSARVLRRIVKQRQLKGGWSKIEEMIEQDILSKDEAERLAPYLRFERKTTE